MIVRWHTSCRLQPFGKWARSALSNASRQDLRHIAPNLIWVEHCQEAIKAQAKEFSLAWANLSQSESSSRLMCQTEARIRSLIFAGYRHRASAIQNGRQHYCPVCLSTNVCVGRRFCLFISFLLVTSLYICELVSDFVVSLILLRQRFCCADVPAVPVILLGRWHCV